MGCPSYVYVQEQQRFKFDPKSRKCIFLGYEKGVKGYKLWDLIAHRKVISRDVVFDEKFMLKGNRDKENHLGDSYASENLVQVELEDTTWPRMEENMVESYQRESSS